MNKNRKIILSALLIAATIVLSRFLSIRTPIISIGFSFVPIILSAILLGPKYSTFIATISDIIGALLFPSGAFFFGFTISSFLTGLIYGLILYKDKFVLDKKFIIRLFISTLIVTLFVNGCLNTVWVIMTTSSAKKIVIPLRIVKQLIMIPVINITMLSLLRLIKDRINSLYD